MGAVLPQTGDYTAEMVGALPSSTIIPKRISELTNDSKFITEEDLIDHTGDTDNPHKVTAAQAGADPTGTAESKVASHNSDTSAHSDIRTALEGKQNALTAGTDGQVLTYDGTNNKWTAKDIEKDIFVATIPLEGGEIAGTTFEELKTAYDAGKILFARPSSELSAVNYYTDYILSLGYVDSDDNGEPITFGFTGIDYIISDTVSIIEWVCTAAGWRDGGVRTIAVPSNHDTATAGQVLTKTDSGSEWNDISSDVFIATYGTTTYNEIKAAYDAGKVLFVKHEVDGVIAPYIRTNYLSSTESTAFYFGILADNTDTLVTYICDSSTGWRSGGVTFATLSDLTGYTKPTNTGTTGQVLTKTSTGSEWADASGGDISSVIGRTTNVNAADTNYSTLMARGEKLLDATTFDAVTDWSTVLVNGAICWRYE